MDEEQVWDLIQRGGGIRRGHFAEAAGHSDVQLGEYNGLVDPSGADTLGRLLAERLRNSGANAVVVWDEVEDLLLGFVVARELGCKLMRVYDDAGLLGHSPGLSPGDNAILIADRLTEPGLLRAAQTLMENLSGSLLKTGVLVATGRPELQDAISLVRFEPHVWAPADCPLCRTGMPVNSPETVPGRERTDV